MSAFRVFLDAARNRHELLVGMVEAGAISPKELRTEEFPFLPEPPPYKKPSDTFRTNIASVDFHATASAAPIGE